MIKCSHEILHALRLVTNSTGPMGKFGPIFWTALSTNISKHHKKVVSLGIIVSHETGHDKYNQFK